MKLQIATALFSSLAFFLASANINAQSPVPQTVTTRDGQTLKLVWNDEFNGVGLPNPADWGYEYGFVRNHESQFYTKEREKNVYQKDSKLIIEAIREDFEENGKKAQFTSASIATQGKHEWTYGRIEVAAKLPRGRGTWPAIWMLGANRSQQGWPKCGEIDIMEYVGFKPGVVHATIHAKGASQYSVSKGSSTFLENVEDRFAVYAVEWTEDKMDFFVDDKLYMTAKKGDLNCRPYPFDKPHYLILNLAIGGQWGAQKGIDNSVFPAKYEIDYVRVYQSEKAQSKAVSFTQGSVTPLFDGTLKNWEPVSKYDFDAAGPVEIKDGAIRINKGDPGAGVKFKGEIPQINYELSYQARRVDGNDFFGLAVLPYKNETFGFVLGGWDGSICGFSCIDGFSADENSTTFSYRFKNNTWYDIKLVVLEKELVVYIDGKEEARLEIDGQTFSNRMEMEPLEPFGFATWHTTAEIRNISIKKR